MRLPTSSPYSSMSVARITPCFSSAYSFVAGTPFTLIAQTGSYAIQTFAASSARTPCRPILICVRSTSSESPSAFCSPVSPMQSSGVSPFLSAQRTFLFSISSVSPSTCRRSEWPIITSSIPTSFNITGEISPLNCPSCSQPMFCAPRWICSGVTVCRARSSVVNDGITNSSSSSREMSAVRSRKPDRNSTVCAIVLYILVFVPR